MQPFLMLGLAAAAGAALVAALPNQALAHAVCGNRIFPATLAIDDPGVSDELALPTLTFLPKNSDGVQEFDASFSYTKTLLPNLGLSVSDGATWLKPGGSGFGNIDTELKYMFYCDPPHELMASFGFDATWASSGSNNFSDPFDTFSPVLDIGKGFGDLPTSLNILRPFAITAEFSGSVPNRSQTASIGTDMSGNPIVNVGLNPTFFNYGFTLQYSLPYMNANVKAVDGPEFLKHLVPIVEADFQTPVANAGPGQRTTTGTIQPGIVYMADTWQIAVEAVAPINNASGKSVGVVAELHFFLDDIFPDSLGKPLFAWGGK